MREILFRAKESISTDWIYGVPWKAINGANLWYVLGEIKVGEDSILENVRVNQTTVGQYTGLTDKTGVKIFEGDIVNVQYISNGEQMQEHSVVCWNECDASFSPWSWAYQCDGCDCFCEIFDVEVIGNIHDNPDLICAEVD